jgi:hypothetical protein
MPILPIPATAITHGEYRLQTLRIPDKPGPAHELYQTICAQVVAHTNTYPGRRAMLDGSARLGTPPELLSFTDWAAIAGPVRDAIETSPFSADKGIRFVWPTVRDHLGHCGVLIGPSPSRSARTIRQPRSTPGTARPNRVGLDVGPLVHQGAVVAFDFAVGLGSVGASSPTWST